MQPHDPASRIEFHPRLVEEAVWLALRGLPGEAVFHQDREPIYRDGDPESRDRRFEALHALWFDRLGIGGPVVAAVREQAGGLSGAARLLVAPAPAARREGAELYVADGVRSIVVSIRPATLADGAAARVLLRRELLHIVDMLDPGFRYEPRLPAHPAGPAHDALIQDRYRTLWDCSVDGRLLRLGRADADVRRVRHAEFRALFAPLGPHAAACFETIFSGERPDHPRLLAIALDPEVGFGLRGGAARARNRCPLCGFPTTAFDRDPGGLPEGARAAILDSFPGWSEDQEICEQCADLYRARVVS